MPERRKPGNNPDSRLKALANPSFRDVMRGYQDFVGRTGLFQGAVVGIKPGLHTGYIWTVLADVHITPERVATAPIFSEVSERARSVIEAVRDDYHLRLAHVTPANLPILHSLYSRAGFTLNTQGPLIEPLIALDPRTIDANTPTDGSLDILIGGLQPYGERLKRAQELALEARIDFGDDEECAHAEEISGLDIFNNMRDRQAGQMLKDITYARNGVLKSAFIRSSELRAEPQKVIAELAGGYTPLDLDQVTALDVTGAIESGTLVPFFESEQQYAENVGRHIKKLSLIR